MYRRDQKGKYAAISAVLAVVLALWITMPLTDRASMDSKMPMQFKGRTVNLKSLGVDVALEGQAPGSPLNGENKGEASSLYNGGNGDGIKFDEAQSGSGGTNASASSAGKNADTSVPGTGAASGGSGSGAGAAGAAKKIASMPALGGASGGNTSAGGVANKMFGSGSPSLGVSSAGGAGKTENAPGAKALAALNKSAAFSQNAGKLGGDAAKNLASAAFDGNKPNVSLNGNSEKAATGNTALASAAGKVSDLKDNDPSLNSTKITPPAPTASAESSSSSMEQQIEQMVIQYALQSMLGAVFGSVGQAISGSIKTAMGSGANDAWSGQHGGTCPGGKCG
jgi:hypothetical protein